MGSQWESEWGQAKVVLLHRLPAVLQQADIQKADLTATGAGTCGSHTKGVLHFKNI